ncbi:MAG TPA: hypothetical protein DC034_08415 [Clostridium sp.]|jgi:hypothetical protein|uniref:ABC-2 family transporter protein n=1 Tax=Clostridium lapidicellarium TaxID=3240931 RepID=A0ABV4E0C2_9CLOT|nr:hypothetical protein [Clostridiales bacterium]HBC96800.1 hypothetical protein [Clostridium sp.]
MNRKLKLYLKNALDKPPVCRREQVEKTAILAEKEYQKHSSRKQIGYLEFLLRQVSFMGKKIWIFQGIVLILIWLFLTAIFKDDFKYIISRHTPDLLCLCAIFITMTGLPFLYRSYKYKMHEVEAATLMSTSRALSSKLIIISLGDGIFLLFTALTVLDKAGISGTFIVFYLLAPFLISFCGCIFIFGHSRGQYKVFTCEVFCLLMLPLQYLFHNMVPQIYYRTSLKGWIALSAFFAAVVVFQICKLIRGSGETAAYFPV